MQTTMESDDRSVASSDSRSLRLAELADLRKKKLAKNRSTRLKELADIRRKELSESLREQNRTELPLEIMTMDGFYEKHRERAAEQKRRENDARQLITRYKPSSTASVTSTESEGSLENWHLQQKQQKKQSRLSTTQAREFLHNYGKPVPFQVEEDVEYGSPTSVAEDEWNAQRQQRDRELNHEQKTHIDSLENKRNVARKHAYSIFNSIKDTNKDCTNILEKGHNSMPGSLQPCYEEDHQQPYNEENTRFETENSNHHHQEVIQIKNEEIQSETGSFPTSNQYEQESTQENNAKHTNDLIEDPWTSQRQQRDRELDDQQQSQKDNLETRRNEARKNAYSIFNSIKDTNKDCTDILQHSIDHLQTCHEDPDTDSSYDSDQHPQKSTPMDEETHKKSQKVHTEDTWTSQRQRRDKELNDQQRTQKDTLEAKRDEARKNVYSIFNSIKETNKDCTDLLQNAQNSTTDPLLPCHEKDAESDTENSTLYENNSTHENENHTALDPLEVSFRKQTEHNYDPLPSKTTEPKPKNDFFKCIENLFHKPEKSQPVREKQHNFFKCFPCQNGKSSENVNACRDIVVGSILSGGVSVGVAVVLLLIL